MLNVDQSVGHLRFSSQILHSFPLHRSSELAGVGSRHAVLARVRDNRGDSTHRSTLLYGPKVNANARTPVSLVTSVRTCRLRDAPATKRIMPDRSKRATPSAPTSAPPASPTGFPSSSTVTAALPAGPGCITTLTSPAAHSSVMVGTVMIGPEASRFSRAS